MAARIMAIADVFDALMNARVYKPAMPPDEVWHILEQGSGKHFDADMVDAFLADFEVFKDIAARFSDQPGASASLPLQALVSRL